MLIAGNTTATVTWSTTATTTTASTTLFPFGNFTMSTTTTPHVNSTSTPHVNSTLTAAASPTSGSTCDFFERVRAVRPSQFHVRYWNRSCYLLSLEIINWPDARRFCQNLVCHGTFSSLQYSIQTLPIHSPICPSSINGSLKPFRGADSALLPRSMKNLA